MDFNNSGGKQMNYNLFQSLKEDIWKIIIWFIGWLIAFLLDVPITFLSAFIIILSGYIIGDILEFIFRSNAANK